MRAREQLTPYKDRTRLFQKGEVFPGVTANPVPRPHAGPHVVAPQLCLLVYNAVRAYQARVPRVLISEGTQLGFGRLSNIAPRHASIETRSHRSEASEG